MFSALAHDFFIAVSMGFYFPVFVLLFAAIGGMYSILERKAIIFLWLYVLQGLYLYLESSFPNC